jgi:hypothetical protein
MGAAELRTEAQTSGDGECVIVALRGLGGQTLSLDLREQLGERVELELFHFVEPPLEFRLVRKGLPLQDWQSAGAELYDLQRPPKCKRWSRDNHFFVNDLVHRTDVATCGLLSKTLGLKRAALPSPLCCLFGLERPLSPRNLLLLKAFKSSSTEPWPC